jgi:hypothetical protein
MKSLVKQICVLSGTSLLALLFTGCGASKVAQCNSIVKTTNQYATIGKELKEVATTTNAKDPEKVAQTFNEVSGKISKVSTDLKALEVKDEKLKDLQNRFVSFYDSTANTFKSAGSSLQKKDINTYKKSLEEMKSIDPKETALVSEINSYCKGK